MQKLPCAERAEWRLLRGQPAQRLSAHYRLGCDYGTALIMNYRDGDPVFLCAAHMATIGPSKDDSIAGVRLVGLPSSDISGDTLPTSDERINTSETPAAKQTSGVVSRPAATLRAVKPEKEANPSHKRPIRDLAYGDSAKALVDETIWNMPSGDYEAYRTGLRQGKAPAEAAQCAGGQFAIVHRKIGEYARKVESILSHSKATIKASDVIDKPFELAALEIIGNSAMSDSEKDAAIDRLGKFQEEINRGLGAEISPLQAHQVAWAIGERANWGRGQCVEGALKPALRTVYASVRNAVRAAVPEAYDFEERLANLCAAKSDLESLSESVDEKQGAALRT